MVENECDTACKRFSHLIDSTLENISETNVKTGIIDRIFTEVLGWLETDISRDLQFQKGFVDYTFRIDDIPRFIIDVKETGESFRIPPSFGGREYKLSGNFLNDDKIKSAIQQARQYSVDSGVRFAIISNGYQFIIFEGFRDAARWQDGTCIVFHSLEDIKENFGLFWSILNRDQIIGASLVKYVSKKGSSFPFVFRPKIVYRHETKI